MGSDFRITDSTITGANIAVGDGAHAGHTYVGEKRLLSSDLPSNRRVFVVHGRDHETAEAVFGFLRDLGLEPWEWEHAVRDLGQASPYSGDVVAHAVRLAQAAVVLLTPDDVVRLHPSLWNQDEHAYETEFAGQPRPNVLIELGMVLAAYPERVVIAEFGDLRQMNDINGRNVVRFADDLETSLEKVAGRLANAGCQVDLTKQAWRRTDRFTDLTAYRRTAPGPAS